MRSKEEINDALDLTIRELDYHNKYSRGALIFVPLKERKWQLEHIFELTDIKTIIKITSKEIKRLRGGLDLLALLERKAILEWYLEIRPHITILSLGGEECTMMMTC